MQPRFGLACLLPLLLGFGSLPAAAGDGGSAFVGGVVGGIVGSAIGNAIQQPTRRVYVEPRRTIIREVPAQTSYQREENRQVQAALNYFGFPAGVPDGVVGGGTRAAMASYQVFMGYPATGMLSDYDRSFLISSYQRAIVGGPQTAQIVATNGQGVRGLLIAYRQEQYGAPMQPPVAPPVAAQPQLPVAIPAAAPVAPPAAAPAEAAAAAPVPVAAKPTIPNFITEAAAPSIAAHCNRTGIATNSNGGPMLVKAGQTIDVQQTLAEQFCLARSYAIDQGDSLAATVPGFSAAELEEQCVAFAPVMRDYAAALPSQSPEQETADLRKFVIGTGTAPAQFSANARICLGVGYRTDNADVALASALVLVGLGEAPYAELVGDHLLYGYGTAKRSDRGLDWINVAVDALDNGATPLVTTNSADRLDLLQSAMMILSVGETQGKVVPAAATEPAPKTLGLPTPASQSN